MKAVANSPTIEGPTALDCPSPDGKGQHAEKYTEKFRLITI